SSPAPGTPPASTPRRPITALFKTLIERYRQHVGPPGTGSGGGHNSAPPLPSAQQLHAVARTFAHAAYRAMQAR
ncbi:MAG: hypothetical protein FJ027_16890, partial [Candidatus Rokubacteria bacterium]|nr:hypothetical protein [Candidatus Rokubacteria bacterium]